jgi:hypothetical protein
VVCRVEAHPPKAPCGVVAEEMGDKAMCSFMKSDSDDYPIETVGLALRATKLPVRSNGVHTIPFYPRPAAGGNQASRHEFP